MNLSQIHNVFFIGIGGIGMSALARYFKNIGKNVSGYDKTPTSLTAELIQSGINIHFEDNIGLIPQDYYTEKKRLRTFIYAVISPAKNLNKIIEIRHVTDSAEEIVNVNFKVILQELKEMEEEKLIELNNDKGDNKLQSPYTRIKLTKKFFSTIKDSS